MVSQSANLSRVTARIGESILEFAKSRVGSRFHAGDLHAHVEQATGKCAPASADRVLRSLRQKGLVDYTVISRSDSLYRMEKA